LADAYAADGQHERAVVLYLEAIERQRTANHHGRPRLKLAGLVLRERLVDRYRCAYEALTDPSWDTRSFFDSDHFEHARDVALLAHHLGDPATASASAARAVTLAATRT